MTPLRCINTRVKVNLLRPLSTGNTHLKCRGRFRELQLRLLNFPLKRSLSSAIKFPTAIEVPEEADVVVIGGGSLGASITYHLQSRGLNTLLLEKDSLTSGTTWHSAGMLWRLRPSDVDIELHTRTRDMCIELEKQTGQASWHENGGLFIATNKERLSEYKRLKEMGKYYDIPCEVLSPSEIHQLHPLINTDDVVGGIYSPTDGTIDPLGIVTAYTKAAKALGAEIRENADVASITTEEYTTLGGMKNRKIKGLLLTDGQYVKTSQIVNATGVWARETTRMVGEDVPLRALKHAFVVTEALDGMHNMLPNVRDHDLSIYLKTQGNAMAIGGYEQNPEFWNVVHDFSFGLFELNFETFDQNFRGHIQRCPAIEHCGIVSTVCGPESFTPDHKPLVGPQLGVRGFFQACGFNSMGMMLGGGIGREIATWIAEGSPELDLFAFNCNRFHPDGVRNSKWVKDRTHESYAKTYSIVFPQDESLAGRGLRKSGIYKALLDNGCVYQARHGFERPGWFESRRDVVVKEYDYYGAYQEGSWRIAENHPNVPKHEAYPYSDMLEAELTFEWSPTLDLIKNECKAAREGVAIFDQSYFGKFLLSGNMAFDAVQYICGADMEDKVLGTVTYTPLCNQRGGVEADLTVANLPDSSGYYFSAGGSTATKDFLWIKSILDEAGFDARIEDVSDSLDVISVQGPHSRSLLQPLVSIPLSDSSFPFSHCRNTHLAGVPLLMMRLTFVGELGYELHVDRGRSEVVYRALKEAGERYENEHRVPVRDAGYRAIDSLSAEKNLRHWHSDLSNKDTPFEAGIGFTVVKKLKRDPTPNFVGREALERQRVNGLRRRLICLVASEKSVPLLGMETIWRGEVCAGLVKSTAYGFTIDKTIAYGYINAKDFEVPTITSEWLKAGEWYLGDRDKKYPASLSLLAPFDPRNFHVKGIYDMDAAVLHASGSAA